MKTLYLGRIRNLKENFAVFIPVCAVDMEKVVKITVAGNNFVELGDYCIVGISKEQAEEIKSKIFAIIEVEEVE